MYKFFLTLLMCLKALRALRHNILFYLDQTIQILKKSINDYKNRDIIKTTKKSRDITKMI